MSDVSEIISDAPEGWTHYGDGNYYKKGKDSPYENPAEDEYYDQAFMYKNGEWFPNDEDVADVDFRFRSDIERICYLEGVINGRSAKAGEEK